MVEALLSDAGCGGVKVAPQADFTITASESERAEILARTRVDPETIRAIHHGIDHERFRPPPSVEAARDHVRRALDISGRYVLYASNHHRRRTPRASSTRSP